MQIHSPYEYPQQAWDEIERTYPRKIWGLRVARVIDEPQEGLSHPHLRAIVRRWLG